MTKFNRQKEALASDLNSVIISPVSSSWTRRKLLAVAQSLPDLNREAGENFSRNKERTEVNATGSGLQYEILSVRVTKVRWRMMRWRCTTMVH